MENLKDLVERWRAPEGKEFKELLLSEAKSHEKYKEICASYFGNITIDGDGPFADLRGFSIEGGEYKDLIFDCADLTGSKFDSCTFEKCNFFHSFFYSSRFENTVFKDCFFASSKMPSSELINCEVYNTSFNYVSLYASKISKLLVKNGDWAGIDLRKAIIKDVDFHGEISFSSAKIPLYLRDKIVQSLGKKAYIEQTVWTEEWL